MPRVVGVVGRTPEIAQLEAALTRAAGADDGAVFILGEPGIGKTRLARETLETARRRGFVTLEARAYTGDAGLGYAPIVTAFGPFLAALARCGEQP